MKNLLLTFLYLSIFLTVAVAQEPGNPGKGDVITKESPFLKQLEKQLNEETPPKGEEVAVRQSKSSNPKKVSNSYIVLLKEDYVAPFAQTKAKFSSRESQKAAADKHELAAEKAIRKYAIEKLGLSNDEIGDIYTGVTSGFSVKLQAKKSSATWISRTKSNENVIDVAQDEELELADHRLESVVDGADAALWGQFADYSNMLVGAVIARAIVNGPGSSIRGLISTIRI